MKKKIFLISFMVALFVCLFAISISATTYNYYENEATEENKLYSIEASFGSKNTRFELISSTTGEGFAKTDSNGTPLTWYVVSDDLGKTTSGVRNIVVKSTPTIGGVVGNVDTNGNYTYGTDTDGVSFSKKVVVANFFGTNDVVKTLPAQAYMATYKYHTPGQVSQYCQVADGSYLLELYLPKSLTYIPKQLCFRSSVIVLEFEDNEVTYKDFGEGVKSFDPQWKDEIAYAFSFCANLKSVVVPEGIENVAMHTFRECISLEYVKFPSTMTRLNDNVFFHTIGLKTVVLGENMTYAGYFNADYKKIYDSWGIKNFNIKYIYVPNTIKTGSSYFDSYRGSGNNWINVDRSVVFFFAGTLEEALEVAKYTDRHFASAAKGLTSASNSTTKGEAPVSYVDYLANKDYYDNLPSNRHLLVYNVPTCIAFHDGHNYEKTVVAPTCTTVGYTSYTCTRCNDTYKEDETAIDENAHVFDDDNDNECNNCGFLRNECVEHNYKPEVTEPDCLNGGFTTYTCVACGESYVDNATDPLGHSYSAEVTDPDCENEGYTTHTCIRCDDTYVDSKTDALGHSYTDINTYKDAITAFEVGEVCSECKAKGATKEYAPLLTYKGYSAQIDGERITLGYTVDKKTQAYLENISYGLVIAIPGEGDDVNAFNPVNPDFTVNGSAKALVREVNKKYDSFNLFVDGFNAENYDRALVLCAFVTDGTKVSYLCADNENKISMQENAKAATYAEISDACTPKYQITFTCDEAMGTLEGETSQTVYEGFDATTVKAVAKEGYTFACWSDGTQTPEITVTAKKKATLTASFVPNSTGLPVITINTENGKADVITLDDYINCEITLFDNSGKGDSVGSAVAEIKGRGNSTWDKFDKKPYKFKFDKKQDLFGYGKEKTWVLLADARDYSLLRNMLALNAGLSMSELDFTSKGQSVELYLNGEYRGVYYLCEQIQIKDNRVNITQEDKGVDDDGDGMIDPDSIGYLVEMDAWATDSANKYLENYNKDGDVFVKIDGGQKAFTIKDPEDVFFDENGEFDAEKAAPYLAYIQGYLQECHDAIYAAKTPENYEKLCELIDVKSFAQAYIIFDLFKNPDTNYSSVYYYKDVNGKLVADPIWDFDMAIGNVTHKSGAGTNAQDFRNTETLWTAEKNNWCKQLLQFPEFKALVGAELVANEAAIKKSIANDLAYARAHKEAYEKNFTKWNLIGNVGASQASGNWSVPEEFRKYATWEDHLNYIENYLNESYAYLKIAYPAPTAE